MHLFRILPYIAYASCASFAITVIVDPIEHYIVFRFTELNTVFINKNGA